MYLHLPCGIPFSAFFGFLHFAGTSWVKILSPDGPCPSRGSLPLSDRSEGKGHAAFPRLGFRRFGFRRFNFRLPPGVAVGRR